jgi:thymidylate synthase (FAD)
MLSKPKLVEHTSDLLKELVGEEFKVLDHGMVRLVDYMGSDAAVVQAARVSYGKGTKKLSEDRGLIRYLMRHRHTTPFEMCELKLHIKLPIFVARQWVRHRTASINEYSARYSIMDKEFYIPDRDHVDADLAETRAKGRIEKALEAGQVDLFGIDESRPEGFVAIGRQSESNRQGREDGLYSDEALEHIKSIANASGRAYGTYQKLLNEDEKGAKLDPRSVGLARELARMVLPINYYTQFYWKIDLHNLLHFLSLRDDSHAQYEIREYARVIGDLVRQWVPLTWEAFEDYRLHGQLLSRQEISLLQRMLKGEQCKYEESGLTRREWNEFRHKLNLT